MSYKDPIKQKQYQKEYYLSKKSRYKDHVRKQRRNHKKWFLEIKKNFQCEKCAEKHPAVIDFHHKDPNKKDNTISRLVGCLRSKKRILSEIDKCMALCANCHRKLHYLKQVDC